MTARCALGLYTGALKIFGTAWLRPGYFCEIYHCFLLQLTLWIFVHNVKSVGFSVPEIIGGAPKNWVVRGYAHAPSSPKFSKVFVRKDPMNALAKFEVRTALPVSELIWVVKNGAVPVYALIVYPPPKKKILYKLSVYTHGRLGTRSAVELWLG